MVKFVAKSIAVDNSDLSEIRDYNPIPSISLTISTFSSYQNGKLTVKVFEDFFQTILKYKIVDEVSQKKAKTLFQGDFEPKLFKGADTIKGSTAGDMLLGFKGGDEITGRGGNDVMYGGAGKDTLYGGSEADMLFGDAGADTLHGGTGANTLYGGKGADAFVFDVALTPGNNSHIADFGGKDQIHLARNTFDGIGPKGVLKGGKFIVASDYDGQKKAVIYDKDTGALSYTQKGGDIGNAVAFGSVTAGLDLNNKDFLIV